MNLLGNYTALITPFKKNLEIDYKTLGRLCEYQQIRGTDGIVALGSTAEASALDTYEKHKVMDKICTTINGTLPIIAGINAFSLNDALYQCSARFFDGADALLVSPPPYIKPTQKGLIKYFNTIADHSFIPIILYNIPSRTAVNIDIQTIEKLSTHPNIIGIKDAGGDISFSQKIISTASQENFSLLSGNDNQLLSTLSIKGKGIISVFGNVYPDLFHNIIFNFISSNVKVSQELYFKYAKLIDALSLESNPIPIKFVMSKLGLIKNYLREPLTPLTKKNKNKINKLLAQEIFLSSSI